MNDKKSDRKNCRKWLHLNFKQSHNYDCENDGFICKSCKTYRFPSFVHTDYGDYICYICGKDGNLKNICLICINKKY
jgi:hypothetical protein